VAGAVPARLCWRVDNHRPFREFCTPSEKWFRDRKNCFVTARPTKQSEVCPNDYKDLTKSLTGRLGQAQSHGFRQGIARVVTTGSADLTFLVEKQPTRRAHANPGRLIEIPQLSSWLRVITASIRDPRHGWRGHHCRRQGNAESGGGDYRRTRGACRCICEGSGRHQDLPHDVASTQPFWRAVATAKIPAAHRLPRSRSARDWRTPAPCGCWMKSAHRCTTPSAAPQARSARPISASRASPRSACRNSPFTPARSARRRSTDGLHRLEGQRSSLAEPVIACSNSPLKRIGRIWRHAGELSRTSSAAEIPPVRPRLFGHGEMAGPVHIGVGVVDPAGGKLVVGLIMIAGPWLPLRQCEAFLLRFGRKPRESEALRW
jgi:hypothetical protein